MHRGAVQSGQPLKDCVIEFLLRLARQQQQQEEQVASSGGSRGNGAQCGEGEGVGASLDPGSTSSLPTPPRLLRSGDRRTSPFHVSSVSVSPLGTPRPAAAAAAAVSHSCACIGSPCLRHCVHGASIGGGGGGIARGEREAGGGGAAAAPPPPRQAGGGRRGQAC
eukprot:COSAG01_NODE_5312_length_4341_cov_18.144036_1_plen_164_part_10